MRADISRAGASIEIERSTRIVPGLFAAESVIVLPFFKARALCSWHFRAKRPYRIRDMVCMSHAERWNMQEQCSVPQMLNQISSRPKTTLVHASASEYPET